MPARVAYDRAEPRSDPAPTSRSRPLHGYVSLSALRRPKVQAFLASVLERHAELAEAAGLVPMSAEQAERARNVVGEPVTPAAQPRGRGG